MYNVYLVLVYVEVVVGLPVVLFYATLYGLASVNISRLAHDIPEVLQLSFLRGFALQLWLQVEQCVESLGKSGADFPSVVTLVPVQDQLMNLSVAVVL